MNIESLSEDRIEDVFHRMWAAESRCLEPYVSVPVRTLLRVRILHTSDWHLGINVAGMCLLHAQEEMLSFIAGIVADKCIDVVVVSGDVYDSKEPPEKAILVCHNAFSMLRCAGAQIVVIPGNHDSPVRLGAGASFMRAAGLHLLTDPDNVTAPVLLTDADGPVAFYGVPYRSTARRRELMQAVMDDIRAGLQVRPDTRSVVLAHAAVADPAARGTNRINHPASEATIPVEVFNGIDYVALGDLHWPHAVNDSVHYAGSPLPYVYRAGPQLIDFDPPKSVWLADIGPDGLSAVDRYLLPMPRRLVTITGTLDSISAGPPSHDYVSVVLTDASPAADARAVLRERFPFLLDIDSQTHAQPQPGAVERVVLADPTRGPNTGTPKRWFGFYGEGREDCLRCGAVAEQPCIRANCGEFSATIRGFHTERGSTELELAENGYIPYIFVDGDSHSRQRLWYHPDKTGPKKRQGCHSEALLRPSTSPMDGVAEPAPVSPTATKRMPPSFTPPPIHLISKKR
ncbi:exonuclease SbcCD subunit D [Nocardia sp. 852002-51244_SCH5132740]|uniref:exonuclease SbcCD subunit D n=1 Tax=Nocardia sp. 852002-51244_SCH5132740 TaxID=1834099 RepID=UPI0007EADCFF|nr:exonuclease SbcCD subunit D C-terminal domain-containing protein [Nocardia sp. 852002-51244_SCH5132740]OBB49119.1 hypothetical protein A5748_20270 [Nocardia sp. 852002-51244_SCH5132740]